MSVAIVKAGAIVTIIAEKAADMDTAIKRVLQWSTMPDASLARLIRPFIIPPVQRKSASFLCLQSACRIGPWVLTCCVDLCSGLPFSQSDKPDSIMDRFSR
ncbi:hypothetical protein AML24_13880 [Escherichia coli]|nr:hypothetical protein AML24_13880 [Escherichia coli]